MILKELNTSFETHRVITYGANRDKAVYHNISMRPLRGCIYVGECETDDYGRESYMTYAFFDSEKIGVAMKRYDADAEVSMVEEDFAAFGMKDLPTYIEKIQKTIDNNSWVTLIDIKLLENVAPELVESAHKARDAHRQRLEDRRIAQEQKRAEEEAAYMKAQNDEAQEIIDKAIDVLNNGGILQNVQFAIYTSGHDGKDYCVAGYLMDKFGISLPIRTRGWINNSLAKVTINADGSIGSVQYYAHGKSKGSTSVWKYLGQMVDAARSNAKEGE